MEHTKGPWKVAAHIFVDDAEGNTVCVPNGDNPSQRVPRAHLIAAAPELLEALKSLGDVVGETLCWCSQHCWDCETYECIMARIAIDKAEGKPNV